ncbi:MAG: M16 family metallopeptidase, partial [Steroidobacteraceae bacterium]
MPSQRLPAATAAALLGAAGGFSHAADQSGISGVKIPPHQRYTLANGVKLILISRHDVPLIAFDAVLRGGARLDPPQRAGLSALTAELLTHGAGTRDAYAFADAVEDAGGHFEAGSDGEAIFLHGEFLARDHALMLELLGDALQRPRFEPDELDKLRERHVEFIKAAKDSAPQRLIGLYGRSLLFGEHPYGRPVGGSETTLRSITPEDVQGFYRGEFGADRLTLVFAGDFEPSALKTAVTAAFAGWHKAAAPLAPLSVPPRVHGRRVLLIDSPGATQTYIWIANIGVDRSYPQ